LFLRRILSYLECSCLDLCPFYFSSLGYLTGPWLLDLLGLSTEVSFSSMMLLLAEISLALEVSIARVLSVRLRLNTLLFRAVSYLWLSCELSNRPILSQLTYRSLGYYFSYFYPASARLISSVCLAICSIILSIPVLLRFLPQPLCILSSSCLNSSTPSSSL